MEAISQAGTCVGVLTKEGIVLGAQKRVVSKLLETKGQTFVFRFSNSINFTNFIYF